MTTAWEVAPPNPQVGAETPLLILDREDGPEGRTICVIPGNLSRGCERWRLRAAPR